MRTKAILFSALACALAFSCAKTPESIVEEAPEAPAAAIEEDEAVSEFVPGVAYVRVTENFSQLIETDLSEGLVETKSAGLNSLFKDLGVTSMSRLFPDAGEFEERTRREGLHRWYKVEFNQENTLTKASASLASIEGIEYVEGRRKLTNNAIFNDPMLSNQWHYINNSVAGRDINVKKVWENYTKGDPKVIVSVVDAGIQVDHEDLDGNTIAGGANGSKNFTNDSYVIEPGNHGTHVAGTIAAVNNNGKGVCGIAGGDAAAGQPGVRLMSCQIFGGEGGDSAAAIKWGADHGAVISSNSWGYVLDLDEDGQISPSELERAKSMKIDGADKAAVDYFIKYAGCDNSGNQLPNSPMKGGVVIFAAGNDNIPYGPPSDYEPIISVGAFSSEGKRASFSNYGDFVDIAAPGVAIRSTVIESGYASMNGTSMACPHVSGVAALIVSYFGGPGFTADMLKERLIKGANPSLLPDNSRIGPALDAYGSFVYGSEDAPEIVTEYSVTPVSNNIEFSWEVTECPMSGDPATGYVLFASTKSLSSLNPSNPGEGVVIANVEVGSKKIGDAITGTISGLEFETKYNVAIAGYDYNHSFSAMSPVKQVTTKANNPPKITTDYSGDYKVRAHATLVVPFTVTDPDGHTISIKFTPGSPACTWVQSSSSGGYQLTIVGNGADPGKYTASIEVTDQYGLKASKEIHYELMANQAPKVVKNIENMLFSTTGEKFTLQMDQFIEDPDGETLKYSISMSNASVLNLNQQGNTLYGTTLDFGLTEVKLVGTDARGLTANQTFKVLVRHPEQQIQAYPNPVIDKLNITNDQSDPTSMDVLISASSGAIVFNGKVNAGAFDPAVIDMGKCAPGIYSLKVTLGGKETKKTIVKK